LVIEGGAARAEAVANANATGRLEWHYARGAHTSYYREMRLSALQRVRQSAERPFFKKTRSTAGHNLNGTGFVPEACETMALMLCLGLSTETRRVGEEGK